MTTFRTAKDYEITITCTLKKTILLENQCTITDAIQRAKEWIWYEQDMDDPAVDFDIEWHEITPLDLPSPQGRVPRVYITHREDDMV